VLVSPRERAAVGIHDDVLRRDAVGEPQPLAQAVAPLARLPPVQHAAQCLAADRQRRLLEQTEASQVQHHLRHAAGEDARTVGCGPFGNVSTRRGTRRFTAIQSSPSAVAVPPRGDGGRVQEQIRRPAEGACTTIALRIAASVTIADAVMPRAARLTSARAERRAMSVQIGWPDGASAE